MSVLEDGLSHRGHDVTRVTSGEDAMRRIDVLLLCDLIILDILMPSPAPAPGDSKVDATAPGGIRFLREVRKRNSKLPVIVISATQDNTIIESLIDDPATTFISKWDSHPIREINKIINARLGSSTKFVSRPFIVHGQDEKTKYSVKNYLQNTLHLPEPIILHEQPSIGRTIFEKFEETAAESDLVFVLLTPDDQGAIAGETNDQKRRARQNVIFEMGYFLGVLGRRSGRILLLHIGPLELPSDLSGVVYIDITNGIESAGETIRRELANVIA